MLAKRILNSTKLFVLLVVIETSIAFYYGKEIYFRKQEYSKVQFVVDKTQKCIRDNFTRIQELETKITSSITDLSKKKDSEKDKDSNNSKMLLEKITRLESLNENMKASFGEFKAQTQSFFAIIGKLQRGDNKENNFESLTYISDKLEQEKDNISEKIKLYEKEYKNIEQTEINVGEDNEDNEDDEDNINTDNDIDNENINEDDNDKIKENDNADIDKGNEPKEVSSDLQEDSKANADTKQMLDKNIEGNNIQQGEVEKVEGKEENKDKKKV